MNFLSKYRKLTCLLLLATGLQVTAAQAQTKAASANQTAEKEIVFIDGSWDAMAKKARATKKYIFFDAYASWCGPCKLLKSTTFKDKAVSDFFNENFVNGSMDMEKGEGPKLATKWGIQGYPTLIVLDASGNVVARSLGFLKPADLLKFGKSALEKKG